MNAVAQAIGFNGITPHSAIETITPDLAAQYLQKNIINRQLRKMYVESLAGDMKRGDFILSHQGIAFDVNGRLIDGQHRLNAVVMSGVSVPMWVTRNVGVGAFRVMDIGAKRTIADSLRVNKKSAEPIAYIVRILTGRGRVTPAQVIALDAELGHYVEKLLEYCGTAARGVSSAPVKAAAVMAMYMNPSPQNIDFVLNTYRDLVLFKVENLPNSGASFLRQLALGSTRKNSADTFCRAMVVFDQSKKSISRIQINDTQATIGALREKLKPLSELVS